MKLILSPRAEKQLGKIPKFKQVLIGSKLRSLAENREMIEEKKLKSYKNLFRVRSGEYRIVYRRQNGKIHVFLIAHRKDVYLLLSSLI